VKKWGLILILIGRISVTQLDRGLHGHYMKEYIMVLA